MSEFRLTNEIIARSSSSNWAAAKLEWTLHEIYEADEPETCLCGHFPIKELCVLRNRINDARATVGNCCVKKFMGLPSNLIFQAVKRVRADSSKSLNAESLSHALEKNWVNQWEYDFYARIMAKRNLTPKQVEKKQQINEKFMRNIRRLNST
ncbi:hypothetical protein ACIQW9_01090 [Herminiimonas sp. NPDC097707]|uniref:hypothetical protein n=1 Tax=Herminiimonas sp. NPDC097707 TaxID=3364007 RepID=UPI00383A5333